jgi:hypothetical protein
MQASYVRILSLCLIPAMMFGMSAADAQTGWQSYVSHELGFSFEAPGGIVSEIGATLRGDIVGTKEQIVFRAEENNIEYRVGVTNFAQAQMMSETILGEALFLFQGEKPILSDSFARVGEGRDMVYGRKSTVELPQGGQATTAFFFTNGKLYQLTATVSAKSGDYASPSLSRFIDSISFDMASFDLDGADPNAVELEFPEF